MKTRFIINRQIEFTPHSGKLKIINSEIEITLPIPASTLLHTLITADRDVIKRDFLFEKVWEQYGITASNSNLNHYIGVLRKSLNTLGLDEDLIKTIPKVGFTLNENIEIKEHKEKKWCMENISLYLIIAFTFIITIKLNSSNLKENTYTKVHDYNNCEIFLDKEFSYGNIKNAISLAKSKIEEMKINCTKNKSIIIFDYEDYTSDLVDTLKTNYFIAHCFNNKKNFNGCDSYSKTTRYLTGDYKK